MINLEDFRTLDERQILQFVAVSHEDALSVLQKMLDEAGIEVNAEDVEEIYLRKYGEVHMKVNMNRWLRRHGYSIIIIEIDRSIEE